MDIFSGGDGDQKAVDLVLEEIASKSNESLTSSNITSIRSSISSLKKKYHTLKKSSSREAVISK